MMSNQRRKKPTGVFISYSGPLSRKIASELCTLLRNFLGIKVRLLPSELGRPMLLELLEDIRNGSFGICCFTADNARSRWIYFEAGALLNLQPTSRLTAKTQKLQDSRIVPLYYPKFPPERGGSDDPLRAFRGISADSQGVFELIKTIAYHFGLTPPLRQKTNDKWTKSLSKIRREKDRLSREIRVGRHNPLHNEVLDNCNELSQRANDFRKFLCDRMLRSMSSATAELSALGKANDFPGFWSFYGKVSSNLSKAFEIVALCGGKPWKHEVVKKYYGDQYDWAVKLGALRRGASWKFRMRRIFVQNSGKRNPQMQRVIREHRQHGSYGVFAGVMTEREIRKAVPVLERVWNNLIKDGFGFIALRSEAGWSLLAHMNKPGRKDFLGVEFKQGFVVHAALDLFELLWRESSVLKPI